MTATSRSRHKRIPYSVVCSVCDKLKTFTSLISLIALISLISWWLIYVINLPLANRQGHNNAFIHCLISSSLIVSNKEPLLLCSHTTHPNHSKTNIPFNWRQRTFVPFFILTANMPIQSNKTSSRSLERNQRILISNPTRGEFKR